MSGPLTPAELIEKYNGPQQFSAEDFDNARAAFRQEFLDAADVTGDTDVGRALEAYADAAIDLLRDKYADVEFTNVADMHTQMYMTLQQNMIPLMNQVATITGENGATIDVMGTATPSTPDDNLSPQELNAFLPGLEAVTEIPEALGVELPTSNM